MKIKSAKYFREKYMTDVRHVLPNTGYDPSFVGCSHQLTDGTYTKGFFDLYHGDKQKVGDFLSNFLKIAEDGQAIYEFLQNAADCNSTLFYMFYNEKYFLAVNNGDVFNQEGLRSLLNVAQSTKSSSSQIGRFGIGFKLVHRLVGKGDGMKELTQDYKGPVMFSWNKKSDLLSLLNHETIEPVNNIEDDSNLPYLLKLILTNFPAEPQEIAKDLNYEDRVLFDAQEYDELCTIVKDCLLPYIDVDNLNQGSLFFIRLGDGKKDLLDKDYEQNFKIGVEYSLNTLKGLNNVKINGTQIERVPLQLENGVIQKDSETFNRIDPEYKDDDIHFSIGYNEIDFASEDPFVKVEALKKSPTFYKYFPLGDEIHQSAIFIHCDSLSNEANRRKMHEDPINKELIPEIAKFIVDKLRSSQESGDTEGFCQLYANLLLSDAPHDNSDWLKEVYYDIIQDYLVTCIPTIYGYADEVSNVKIKRITTNIPLSVVNDNLQWFKWNSKNVETIINSAKSKLGIDTYDVVDLIVDSDVDRLNTWIATANESDYSDFLKEINSTARLLTSNTKFLEKIKAIKLFKFCDGVFRSYNDFVKYKPYNFYYIEQILYKTNKFVDINDIMSSLGFVLSELNIDSYQKIKECFPLPLDKDVFPLIGTAIENKVLTQIDKKRLIFHLTSQDPQKKLEGVGSEKIKSLCLCENMSGQRVALGDMLSRSYNVPSWLSSYLICAEDYFPELDRFLMAESDIYRNIIYPNWDKMQPSNNIVGFYADVKRLYDLDSDNNRTLKGKSYIYTENGVFTTLGNIVFNTKMLEDSIDYKGINNIVTTIFKGHVPNKDVEKILENEPFGLSNTNISNWTPDPSEGVMLEDIKTLLKFCVLNNETFFKAFVINCKDGVYYIQSRTSNYYQVYAGNASTKSYIEEEFSNEMIPLPKNLEEYKDSEGIISGQALHALILKGIDDVDNAKEELIDIVSYDARASFIKELSTIEIDLDEDTSIESYSFKVINMACKVIDNDNDIINFRKKLVISKKGVKYTYDQIPQSIAESFEVEGAKKKFELAKVLPNENANGSLLIDVADKYSSLGVDKAKINSILGISDNADVDSIYETLVANYSILQNDQQLAFLITYCKSKGLSLPKYKLNAVNSEDYDGDSSFFVKRYDFIGDAYILTEEYAHLGSYIDIPYQKKVYLESPYIDDDNKFICPGIETKLNDEIDYTKVISLLTQLSKLRQADKDKFESVDWSTIKKDLGFDPSTSVYPSSLALDSEQLPEEVEKWISESPSNEQLVRSMDVATKESIVVRFRKYMTNASSEFDCQSLYSVDNCTYLQNSLAWLAGKDVFPLSEEKFKALGIAIERINTLRNSGGIVVTDNFAITDIDDDSIEYIGQGYTEWKTETEFSIYLYDGKLPHHITIDEYIDGNVYCYSDGDIATNGKKTIYVNREADLQDAMHHLANQNDIGLTREDVYKLFNRSISDLEKEIQRLKDVNQKLREGLPVPQDDVRMYGEDSNDVDELERPEWNEVARKKVKKKLEAEGFKFTQGIGNYSDIPGVIDPDGNPVHLVVKSCRWGKLYINPIEWGTLLKPNAMLWIFDGHDAVPLHLRALIRNQDELVLKIDTRNLDDVSRVSKFAQILQYFKQIHFDFSSVRPTTIASTYKEYAFDDRSMDEALEEDDFE